MVNNNEKIIVKKKISTFYLVMIALFTALTFVVTYFVNIPAATIFGAGGNINLGDTIIFLASVILGPIGGAIAGAIGATAADLASSYVMYAPFTFIIKGAAGFLCGALYKYILKEKNFRKFPRLILSILSAALVIVVGYFIAEVLLLLIIGTDSFSVALLMGLRTILPNLLQVGISMGVALLAMPKMPEISAERI